MAKKYCYILIEGAYELDLNQSSDLPLSINKQFATSNLDGAGSGGVYTFTFTVPASKPNIKILKRLFPQELQIPQAIAVDGQPVDAAGSSGYPLRGAEIIVNGMTLYKGQIALLNGKSFNIPESYEFTFYADNGDWITRIKGKTLDELKFYSDTAEELKINFVYLDIHNANAQFPNNAATPWCFPMISYGAFGSYIFNVQGGVSETGEEGNSEEPGLVRVSDLRPALSIYQMVKEIFRQFHYRIESDFLEGNFFQRLIFPFGIGDWTIKKKEEVAKEYKAGYKYQPLDEKPPDGGCWFPSLTVYEERGLILGADNLVDMWNGCAMGGYKKDYDDQSMFIQHDGEYGSGTKKNDIAYFEVPLTGLWNIRIDLDGISGTSLLDKYRIVKRPYIAVVKDLVVDSRGRLIGGQVIRKREIFDGSKPLYNDVRNVGPFQMSVPFSFNEGDKIYIYLYGGDYVRHHKYWSDSDTDNQRYTVESTKIEISYADQVISDGNPETVEPISVSDTLPGDQKQIDFLRGLFHLFNLVAETDTQAQTIRIEPRDEVTCWDGFSGQTRTYKGFYDRSQSPENWTPKADVSQENISEITTDLAKKVYLSYNGNQKYYTSVYDFGRDFAKSEEDTKENPFFSQVLHVRDGRVSDYFNKKSGTSNPVVPLYMPKMWDGEKDENGNFPTQTFKHDPAILFYHGQGPTNDPQNYGQSIFDGQGTTYNRHYHFGLAYVVCYDDTTGFTPSLSFCTEELGKSFNPDDETKWIKVKGLAELFYLQYFSQLRDGIRLSIPIYLKDLDFRRLNSRIMKQLFGRSYVIEQFKDYNPTLEGPTEVQLLYAKPSEYLDFINLKNGNQNDDDVGSTDDGVSDEGPPDPPETETFLIPMAYLLSYQSPETGNTVDLYWKANDGEALLYTDREGTPVVYNSDYTYDPQTGKMVFTAPVGQGERINMIFSAMIQSEQKGYWDMKVVDYQNTTGSPQSIIQLADPDYDLFYIDRNGSELYPADGGYAGPDGYSYSGGELTPATPLQPMERLHFVGMKFIASDLYKTQFAAVTYQCLALDGEQTVTLSTLAGGTILLFKRGLYGMAPGTDYTYNINTATIQFTQKLQYKEVISIVVSKTTA